MDLTFKLGTFRGIPLVIHWSLTFFLGLTFFQSMRMGMVFLLVYAFVILHEYGHSLTAQKLGLRTGQITMYPMGGVARIFMPPNEPGLEFFVIIMGPTVNMVLFLFFQATAFFLDMAGYSSAWCELPMTINLVLMVFNFLPAFPMDGGRLFRSALNYFSGNYLWATTVAVRLGQVLCVGLSLYGCFTMNPLMILMGPFLAWVGQSELVAARTYVQGGFGGLPL